MFNDLGWEVKKFFDLGMIFGRSMNKGNFKKMNVDIIQLSA